MLERAGRDGRDGSAWRASITCGLGQAGRSHMAFVTDHGPKIMQWLKSDRTTPYPADAPIVGVITIEDIIEELIQESVEDEVDLLVRHNQARMTM